MSRWLRLPQTLPDQLEQAEHGFALEILRNDAVTQPSRIISVGSEHAKPAHRVGQLLDICVVVLDELRGGARLRSNVAVATAIPNDEGSKAAGAVGDVVEIGWRSLRVCQPQ